MSLVNQPTVTPTRKVTAAVVAASIVPFARAPLVAVMDIVSGIQIDIGGYLIPILGGLADSEIQSAAFVGLSTGAIYAAGYIVRDKANITAAVPADDPETIKTTPAVPAKPKRPRKPK